MFRVTRIRLFAKAVAAIWENQRVTCDIEVQAPKSITLSTTNVSVAPGENYFIDYTINPPSDSLDLSRSAETSAVIFTDQGHDDKGRGKIMVTGIKPGTAQIYAFTNPGGVYAKCAITCEWDYRFKLTKESNRITKIPGQGNSLRTDETYEDAFTFSVTTKPEDAVIELSLSPYPLALSESELKGQPGVVYSVSEHADGSRHYKIWAPQNLTQDVTLYITATNPRDNDRIFGQAQISGSFQYNKITPTLSFGSMSDSFGYSRFDAASGAIYVGDGEAITLNVGLKEKFVPDNQWSLVGADLKLYGQAASSPQISLNGNTYTIANSVSKSTDAKTVTLTNPLAVAKKYWNITELKVPIINVQASTYEYRRGRQHNEGGSHYNEEYTWEAYRISTQKQDVNLLDYISWDKFFAKRQSTSSTNYKLNDFLEVGAMYNGKISTPSVWDKNYNSKNSQYPAINYTKVEAALTANPYFIKTENGKNLEWESALGKGRSTPAKTNVEGVYDLGYWRDDNSPFEKGETITIMEITNVSEVQAYGLKTLRGNEIPEKYRFIEKEDYKEIPWFYLYEHNYFHDNWNVFGIEDWTGKAPETDTGNCTKKEAYKPDYIGRDLYGLQTGILTVTISYKGVEQKIQFPVYTSCYENLNKRD